MRSDRWKVFRRGLLLAAGIGAASVLAAKPAAPPSAPPLPYCPPAVVDASSLDGKFMFGYQGWFGYPGDGSENNAWFHWKGERDGAVRYTVDLLPDVTEYGSDELVDDPYLKRSDGSPIRFYSAYNPKTVERHFEWMRQYGLDGVFLQRFSAETAASPAVRAFRDQVTRNVMAAARKNGRVFALMYDISGDQQAGANLERDWTHLVDDLGVTRSPRYLRHKGRPVLAVWGLGFKGNPADVAQAAALIRFFKDNKRPELRVTLVGGVPTGWRTLSGDSYPDTGWAAIYRSFDVISPWTVNRYNDPRSTDRFRRRFLEPDMVAARKAGREYLPVVFPGYSAHHLNAAQPLNEVRRAGGVFFWHQAHNALQAGATMLYGAMFDEVDEGTAFYKTLANSGELPTNGDFVALDADGYVLPSDWYLKLAGFATMALHGVFKAGGQMPLDLAQPGHAEGCFSCGAGSKPKAGSGGIISVNFMGGGSDYPGPMAPAERAGHDPAAYWNNAEFEEGVLPDLQDDAGGKTGCSLHWHASDIWDTPIRELPGDARMMKGYLDAPEGVTITVRVDHLPERFAKGYRVYVYSNGDNGDYTRQAVFTLGAKAVAVTDPPADFFKGRYVFSGGGHPGNMAVFEGLTGTAFVLSATPGPSTGPLRRSPLNGIQIVAGATEP